MTTIRPGERGSLVEPDPERVGLGALEDQVVEPVAVDVGELRPGNLPPAPPVSSVSGIGISTAPAKEPVPIAWATTRAGE